MKSSQDLELVENWLDSDEALFDLVQAGLKPAGWAISGIAEAVDTLASCRRIIGRLTQVPRSQIYIQAMQNELRGSSVVREALLALKRAPSDQLDELLTTIVPRLKEEHELKEFHARLQTLIGFSNAEEPFRSEHDVRNETMRTTVVAQRVELSRHKGNLSKNDSAYSKILTDVHNWLEKFFDKRFIDVNTVFLKELFIFDQRVPHRAAFAPKTRLAIERALSSPHDYLACDCCALDPEKDSTADTVMRATHPATCLLYQLYLESGPLINASDLWNAFLAVVADDEVDDKENMAMFERALSELQYLGFIKGTRKKTDHIVKVAWKGL